jgi:hypothetical protein
MPFLVEIALKHVLLFATTRDTSSQVLNMDLSVGVTIRPPMKSSGLQVNAIFLVLATPPSCVVLVIG